MTFSLVNHRYESSYSVRVINFAHFYSRRFGRFLLLSIFEFTQSLVLSVGWSTCPLDGDICRLQVTWDFKLVKMFFCFEIRSVIRSVLLAPAK